MGKRLVAALGGAGLMLGLAPLSSAASNTATTLFPSTRRLSSRRTSSSTVTGQRAVAISPPAPTCAHPMG
ncbi:hypothetical protein I553_5708 [Mycobacterium xenopi 4042]|uniref:Uncharacterized protein n=1 Tax=Mycobacterium xenopi 4042 TaxID=1299334 RepID=X7ZUT4_MYCXE|nr:hypothetical protein I553_5708 [Mycobacterium xenopi 4042]